MQNRNLTIAAVVAVSAVAILSVMYFMRDSSSEQKIVSPDTQVKEVAPHAEDGHDHGNDSLPRYQDTRGFDAGAPANSPPPIRQPFASPQPPSTDGRVDANREAPSQRMDPREEQAMEQQMGYVYEDLFSELSLNDEQRKKLSGELGRAMQKEAELGPDIINPNIPVGEVLRKQELLNQQKIGESLSPTEQNTVKEYRENMPKTMQKKSLSALVDSLGYPETERENIQRIVEQAVDRTETQKQVGQMTERDILDLRQKFGGKKEGTPEFFKASLDLADAEVKSLLKNLEGNLPQEQYDRLREEIEGPLKQMQQQVDNPQAQQRRQ